MQEILERIASIPDTEKTEYRGDGYWINASGSDPVEMARAMREFHARLSTVTAVARPDGETDLIYHYFLSNTAFNIRVTTRSQSLPSIANLIPAADWIEREIHDLYAVQFEGHPDLRRLVRPLELPEGFFRQPGGSAAKSERTA